MNLKLNFILILKIMIHFNFLKLLKILKYVNLIINLNQKIKMKRR